MPMSTPHHVHDGHGVPAVPPSFMQTGSQQQLPDSLWRDASWYLRMRAEAARRRAARWVACAAGALVLAQLHLLVLFAHVADKHRPTQGFALLRGTEPLYPLSARWEIPRFTGTEAHELCVVFPTWRESG